MADDAPFDDRDALRALIAHQPDVQLALLFGSYASGRLRADSDVDLAIFADEPLSASRRLALIEEVARVTGRPVDLVDLRVAGIPVAHAALTGGQVLFSRDEELFPKLLARVLIDAADFLPIHERILRERRAAWLG